MTDSGDSGTIFVDTSSRAIGQYIGRSITGKRALSIVSRMKYVLDLVHAAVLPTLTSSRYMINWGAPYSVGGTKDVVTSIAINDQGQVVMGYVDKENSSRPSWRTGLLSGGSDQVTWRKSGSISSFAKAGKITIALNQTNVCIGLEKNSDGNDLYSNVATLNPATGDLSWNQDDDNYEGSATFPASGISGSYCFDLHEGDWGDNLYYRVGEVNSTNKTVDWGKSISYDNSGQNVAGAVNALNIVVDVHEGWWNGSNLYYRVGMLYGADKQIKFEDDSHQFGSGHLPSVALDDLGRVVEVHIDDGWVKYQTGYVSVANEPIEWSPFVFKVPEIPKDAQAACVSTNGRGEMVLAVTAKDGGVSVIVGHWAFTPLGSG